jgi:hypothetical protein
LEISRFFQAFFKAQRIWTGAENRKQPAIELYQDSTEKRAYENVYQETSV